MTKEFYTKHKDEIEKAIKNATVSYNMNSSKNGKVAVHVYNIATKKVCISVLAVKNRENHITSKYILKITVAHDTKAKKEFAITKDTGHYACRLFNTLSAKHDAQIAKTQLKKNFDNQAFKMKR